MHGFRYLKVLFITSLTLTGLACGGGGSDSESTNNSNQSGFEQIEIQPLPTSIDVNEGDVANIRIVASGSNVSSLNYQWTVGDDIEFEGQGRSSIQFVAPQVEGRQVVSVSVQISSSEIRLIGNTRFSTSVIIEDTTLAEEPAALTDLPAVESLDFVAAQELPGIWRVTEYVNIDFVEAGLGSINLRRTSEFDVELVNTDLLLTCGEETIFSTIDGIFNSVESEQCAVPNTVELYQDGRSLRQEIYCDNVLVSAIELSKSFSDTRRQYQFDLSTGRSIDIEGASDVCLFESITRVTAVTETEQAVPPFYISSITANVLDDPSFPTVTLTLDGRIDESGTRFISTLDRDEANSFEYSTLGLVFEEGEAFSGTISPALWSETSKELTWDLNYRTEQGDSFNLTGRLTEGESR